MSHRISAYEAERRPEAPALRHWEVTHFSPLVMYLADKGHLSVLSWEDLIEAMKKADPVAAAEVELFYDRCLSYL